MMTLGVLDDFNSLDNVVRILTPQGEGQDENEEHGSNESLVHGTSIARAGLSLNSTKVPFWY